MFIKSIKNCSAYLMRRLGVSPIRNNAVLASFASASVDTGSSTLAPFFNALTMQGLSHRLLVGILLLRHVSRKYLLVEE